jgi:hypothetical protein
MRVDRNGRVFCTFDKEIKLLNPKQMRPFRYFVLFVFFLQALPVFCQQVIPRGTLVLEKDPEEVLAFENSGTINLAVLRSCTNFLTDHDIRYYKQFAVPRRKKAFLRHVKHISEFIESSFFKGKKVTAEERELFYELALLELSLKQSATSSNSVITKKDQLQMRKDFRRSATVFSYPVPSDQPPAGPEKNSPFWHARPDSIAPYRQFDEMARTKKIKAKKNMVVIFDALSYSGSAPKIRALDLDFDNEWSLKWGDEIHTDVLGSRIFAALGYDVDHPYYYGRDKVVLVFDGLKPIRDFHSMRDSLTNVFGVDITPFVSDFGIITDEHVAGQEKLGPYLGLNYVRFIECGLEARPDRVKRLGSFVPGKLNNELRRELRAAILAHAFIGNWDTREMNTLLTIVHDGNYNYRVSGVFSDLGTSLGVHVNAFPADFKVGLVNELPWQVAEKKNGTVHLLHNVNAILQPYAEATYADLCWMAGKIETIDSLSLREMVDEAGWPKPVEELYFHKMASRRASILDAFAIVDNHPITYDRNLTVIVDSCTVIKDGVLLVDYHAQKHPESFISKKGRLRNYGH